MIPKNYTEAKDWLAGGRNKNDRPMYWHGMRVQTRGNDIAAHFKWAGMDLALYHPDNTMTISLPVQHGNWGTWFPIKSQGIRYALTVLSGVHSIYQKNYEHYLIPRDPDITPSKIQGCKSCRSTGKLNQDCLPKSCWGATQDDEGNWRCKTHDALLPNRVRWHQVPCEHGKMGHTIYRATDCWYCAGKGKREYGLKRIPIKWDGSPLRLKDGKLIKREQTELEKRISEYVRPLA